MTATPNHALQRTRATVTATATHHLRPCRLSAVPAPVARVADLGVVRRLLAFPVNEDSNSRGLTAAERQLVQRMLEHGSPDARQFLPQLAVARVTPWRCQCGCASFQFYIPGFPAPTAAFTRSRTSCLTPETIMLASSLTSRAALFRAWRFMDSQAMHLGHYPLQSYFSRSPTRPQTPNHALQRTRSAVTAHAPTTFAPAAFPHGPRPLRVSLSLGSLGDYARLL